MKVFRAPGTVAHTSAAQTSAIESNILISRYVTQLNQEDFAKER